MIEPRVIIVGIGEYKVAKSPCVLRTVLGSCVGVCMYDSAHKIGGCAHVYLPDSKCSSAGKDEATKEHGYADVLIPLLIEELRKLGSEKEYITAYLAGGANLFAKRTNNTVNMGEKNLSTAKAILRENGIPFSARHVGGVCGRKVLFHLVDGEMEVTELPALSDGRVE